ncbi:MAG TPA: thioredoxin [Longimicrobium sp.]|uniref:thioredoxin n=1 Tax=Longimicrobium sp. TaxID=2029185 RepID=UPI002EDB9DAB
MAETRATVACNHCGRLNRVDLARAADGPRCGQCKQAIALDHPMYLTDASFDRVVADSPVPVVVDFYADWCGPCKIMAPVLDMAARERMGTVLVAKVDTDRNPTVSMRFNIRSIPTLVVMNGGRETAREMGAIPRTRLNALIDAALR